MLKSFLAVLALGSSVSAATIEIPSQVPSIIAKTALASIRLDDPPNDGNGINYNDPSTWPDARPWDFPTAPEWYWFQYNCGCNMPGWVIFENDMRTPVTCDAYCNSVSGACWQPDVCSQFQTCRDKNLQDAWESFRIMCQGVQNCCEQNAGCDCADQVYDYWGQQTLIAYFKAKACCPICTGN